MICMGKRWSHFDLSLSRSFRVLIVGCLEKIQKKQKTKKIAFKIARAREYSKSISLSHIDQTHNLKQQSALERERERERERRRREREDTTRRSHDDARTRIQLFARGTLANHPTRTPGVEDDEYYHDDDGPKDDDE